MEFWLPMESYERQHRFKYAALYHALRDAIHAGTLASGTRLPSTRDLARQYNLSRGSVAQVYDMLLADGYVRAYRGKGTYVSDTLTEKEYTGREAKISLSPWGKRVANLHMGNGDVPIDTARQPVIDFNM